MLHDAITKIDESVKFRRYIRRENLEVIERNTELLIDHYDRTLIQMFFQGHTLRGMSKFSGKCLSTIQRQLKRIIQQLTSTEYRIVMQNPVRYSKSEQKYARYKYICGMSVRKIREETGMSLYRARQLDQIIRRKIKESGAVKEDERTGHGHKIGGANRRRAKKGA
ncbi:MAG: hypothetical protein GY845_29585 [Planctomycetes bacterium]|nr:hypothetical protein [Planctomycetota bacterium]